MTKVIIENKEDGSQVASICMESTKAAFDWMLDVVEAIAPGEMSNVFNDLGGENRWHVLELGCKLYRARIKCFKKVK